MSSLSMQLCELEMDWDCVLFFMVMQSWVTGQMGWWPYNFSVISISALLLLVSIYLFQLCISVDVLQDLARLAIYQMLCVCVFFFKHSAAATMQIYIYFWLECHDCHGFTTVDPKAKTTTKKK